MIASQLPPDVIHEILENAPDFATLATAIRISKKHHEVFKAHPKSIVRAVAENVAGPALLPAARLAQYHRQVDRSDVFAIPDLPEENHFATVDFKTSPGLIHSMNKNAAVVRILRNFYSQRRKDRMSSTNALSPEETLRFDRAVYRYWLWHQMLQEGAVWKHKDVDTDEEDDEDDEEFDQVFREEFTDIVKSLPTEELFEILHVNVFVEETRQWRSMGHNLPYGGADLASLAHKLLERGVDVYAISSCRSWSPIADHIKDVLLSRKLKPEQLDGKTSSAVVTAVVGAADKCSRCEQVGGVELLGTPNMFLLSGLLAVRDRISLLPGVLHRNREVVNPIFFHLMDGQRPVAEGDIFHEMLDLDLDPADFDTFPDEHWSKDGWYCLGCIKALYRQRFMPWWRKTIESDGTTPVKDDCWYGYNCRTMTHKTAHAMKLNHLCKPTRGDAPASVPAPILPPQPINNAAANDPN